MAKSYELDKKDMSNLGKVAIYSGLAAALAVLVGALTEIDFPVKYAPLVPIINVLLVGLKDYFENRA